MRDIFPDDPVSRNSSSQNPIAAAAPSYTQAARLPKKKTPPGIGRRRHGVLFYSANIPRSSFSVNAAALTSISYSVYVSVVRSASAPVRNRSVCGEDIVFLITRCVTRSPPITRLCHHKREKTQGRQGKKGNCAKIIRTCSQKTNTEAFKERRAPRVNSDKGKWRFTAEQIVKRSSF